jgi:hypothetical protein
MSSMTRERFGNTILNVALPEGNHEHVHAGEAKRDNDVRG